MYDPSSKIIFGFSIGNLEHPKLWNKWFSVFAPEFTTDKQWKDKFHEREVIEIITPKKLKVYENFSIDYPDYFIGGQNHYYCDGNPEPLNLTEHTDGFLLPKPDKETIEALEEFGAKVDCKPQWWLLCYYS